MYKVLFSLDQFEFVKGTQRHNHKSFPHNISLTEILSPPCELMN